ncbi:programmed cell death protein 2 [Trichoderma novae-zelandiae]
MADYASDSSEGEFTETNVLLGYASKEADEDTISKLGGTPDWLDAGKPPSAALARCKVCKDLMALLLQLNGELPEKFPSHERRLYVFACRRATCRRKAGSVRALRGVRVWKDAAETTAGVEKKKAETKSEPEEKKKKEEEDGPRLGESLFGAKPLGQAGGNPFSSGANPFSSGSSNPFSTTSSSSNPFSSQPAKPAAAPAERPAATSAAAAASTNLSKTFAETLALNTTPASPPPPPEPWPEKDAQPTPYPTLYLADADYETLDPSSTKLPANVTIADADAPEPSALDREAFESAMDATFQKFADRMAQNPEQCIRYEFGGAPLLYSKSDAVGELLTKRTMPGCPNCGGRRTFEVQLTPNAITELEEGDLSLDGMEWGTIIVGVCERDCSLRHVGVEEAGYLEEWAGVQWEELSKGK